jgi:hypothetical protein
MDQERLAEIEKSLRNAEDALLRLQEQKKFLLDQIAFLKRKREFLLKSGVAETQVPYPSVGVGLQSSEQLHGYKHNGYRMDETFNDSST